MGFIQAFKGAISGTFADQWLDYYTIQEGISETFAVAPIVKQAQNRGVGENTKGYDNIISNGSKIIVPEKTALITMQDGKITGCITEAGGYIYKTDDPNAQSLFAGDGIFGNLIKSTWEKVKFGGIPAAQQLAFYVNLKEIGGLKFGTKENLNWYDNYFVARIGGVARGTYSVVIGDPLTFVTNYVPAKYLQASSGVYDFADFDNASADQLFQDFVDTLEPAMANVSTEAGASPEKIPTFDFIQKNKGRFTEIIRDEIENRHHWLENKGIRVENVAITIAYNESTNELMEQFAQDAREIEKQKKLGAAYGENMAGMMAAASGSAMQSAAANENGAMMGFMGMNMAQQGGANMMGAINNMQQPAQPQAAPVEQPVQSPTDKVLEMKKLLDAGAISQEEFDKIKKDLLGL